MIEPPVYIYINEDAQLGGILSFITKPLKKVVGWVAGKGNTPGTKETRKYGYSPTEVAAKVAENIKNEPPAPAIDNKNLLLGGAAAIALFLLLSKPKSRRYGKG